MITHKPSGRTTTYGKVAEAAAKLEPPKEVKLKDPKDWKIAGKPLKRLDTADKLTGKQLYSIDVKLPGMLNAAIKECPVFGGKVKSFDAAKVAGMPGVKKVVQVGDTAVAVVADTWWHAKTALDALPIDWDEGAERQGLERDASPSGSRKASTPTEAFVGNKQGDAKAAIAGAAKKVEAVYAYPFQNHASMEPMNATALYTPDKCEVWTSTQNGEAALAAAVGGVRPAGRQVRRPQHDRSAAASAGARAATTCRRRCAIAKQMPGTPIKLIKSREEDMTHGVYHPITQCKLTGALDANNNLTGLHMRISGQSILAAVRPGGAAERARSGRRSRASIAGGAEGAFGYTIPNLLIDHAMRNPHVPPWFWRGVNNNQNAIYLECFMDELAHAAGQDPLEFRRKLMAKHPKHLARAQCGGRARRLGQARAARRLSAASRQHMGYGSYVAAAAEVSVSDGNKVKIHRIVAATDLRPRGQSRRRSSGRSPARSSTACPPLFYGEMHGQGRPHRADQLRHLQLDAHQRDAEGRSRSSCRPATSGAASASRRSSWRRRRCSTRSSRRPASASARSR